MQELLVEPRQREHGNDPIASYAPLALTPMVYVMWQDRYDAFIAKFQDLNFKNLGTAEGRWGKMKVVYPKRSVWNDNPYYVLDVPWSSSEQREAATLFRNFLLTKDAQKVARDQYLFRPASLDVPIIEPGSAFSKLEGTVQVDVPAIKRPSAEVLTQLIQVWKRVH